ncbi:hypothetical protein GCM10022239_19110 [Leifsonia bigeumensis]|uniref:Uncharacterized protein n=1 Tax=Leifsonella bigeumensis TaxID=433643 RepID=A0ABP7FNJ3_9MICO
MADNEETSAEGASTEEIDALLSRLRVIEDQPLEDRAAAFAQVYDELRRALEGADAPAPRD